MDKLKDMAGKATGGGGGGEKKAEEGGQQQDYVDKGLAAGEKKMGYGGVSDSTNEQITDKGREMFEKQTGKDVPEKVSN